MRPSSGGRSPDIWLISVVLPAPFGPMMACISPAMTSSVTSSVTARLPKFLRSPCSRNTGSEAARSSMTKPSPQPGAESDQAAAGEKDDQYQDRSENHFPVIGEDGQPLLGQKIGSAAAQADVKAPRRAE